MTAFASVQSLPGEWTAQAACAATDVDPDWWHPANEESREARMAVTVCGRCSVRVPCLDYALSTEVHGIWAGTTYKQRNRMRGD